jgi:lysophospholipase L1-like esterase
MLGVRNTASILRRWFSNTVLGNTVWGLLPTVCPRRQVRPRVEELESRDLPTTLVMPLGASITAGYPSNSGGYRVPLLSQLSAAGINITYVGSQTTYNPPSQPNLQHEGHPGYLIGDIDSLVQGGVITQYNPDIILLYLGTNNLLADQNAPWVKTDYGPLLDDIFAAKSSVKVIVSPLFTASGVDGVALNNFDIGTRVFDAQQHVVGYNGGLAQLVTAEQQGHNITFVDSMRSALTAADLGSDGVHPTDSGYQKMAAQWLTAVQAITPGQLTNVAPTAPTGLVATVFGSQVNLTWTRNSLTESSFKVDVATSFDFSQGLTTLTAPAGSNHFTVTGLAPKSYYFRVRATNSSGDSANSLLASATVLPPGWVTTDIGGPGVAGSTLFDGTTWAVQGGGAGIWDPSDQFQYAYTTVSGNATFVTRVTSVQNTADCAEGGLMFRDGTSAVAPYVAVEQYPNKQVEMQWRDTAGGTSDWNGASLGDTTSLKWLKLTRSGNVFTGYYATTAGVPADSDWVLIGTHTLAMAAPTVGLAVTAQNDSALCTATFTNVSLTGQWVQTTVADFSAGSNSGTQVTNTAGGEVQLASGSLNGTFTSALFDATRLASWGNVSWTATVPTGTTLTVQTRSGNSSTPDGTWSAWTTVVNGQSTSSSAGRYLQYRVTFTSTSASLTPVLFDITFLWN